MDTFETKALSRRLLLCCPVAHGGRHDFSRNKPNFDCRCLRWSSWRHIIAQSLPVQHLFDILHETGYCIQCAIDAKVCISAAQSVIDNRSQGCAFCCALWLCMVTAGSFPKLQPGSNGRSTTCSKAHVINVPHASLPFLFSWSTSRRIERRSDDLVAVPKWRSPSQQSNARHGNVDFLAADQRREVHLVANATKGRFECFGLCSHSCNSKPRCDVCWMLFRQWSYEQQECFAISCRENIVAGRTSSTCSISEGNVLVLQKWKERQWWQRN